MKRDGWDGYAAEQFAHIKALLIGEGTLKQRLTWAAVDRVSVLQPHMIPELCITFGTARDQINDALVELGRRGYLSGPWLGDETSGEVAAYYQSRAMDKPNSSYQAMLAYQTELRRIHDTLQRMEDNYSRTEGDNAALWGRKA